MSNYGNKKESSQEGSFLLRLEQNVINVIPGESNEIRFSCRSRKKGLLRFAIIPGESNEIRFSCRSRKKGLLRHAITSTSYKSMTKKFEGGCRGAKGVENRTVMGKIEGRRKIKMTAELQSWDENYIFFTKRGCNLVWSVVY